MEDDGWVRERITLAMADGAGPPPSLPVHALHLLSLNHDRGVGELHSLRQRLQLPAARYTVLRDANFPHPTLTESRNNLFTALDAASRPVPQEHR